MGKKRKALHPADQQRKAARKKELKKVLWSLSFYTVSFPRLAHMCAFVYQNKVERTRVREVALQRKTPEQILDEINKIRKQGTVPPGLWALCSALGAHGLWFCVSEAMGLADAKMLQRKKRLLETHHSMVEREVCRQSLVLLHLAQS